MLKDTDWVRKCIAYQIPSQGQDKNSVDYTDLEDWEE